MARASGQSLEAVVTGVWNLCLWTSESHLVFKAARRGRTV